MGSSVVLHAESVLLAISRSYLARLHTEWTIAPDGEITVKTDVKWNHNRVFLPRFGLRLFLPREQNACEYFGFGPYESYIDKHRASYMGRFHTTAQAQFEPYLKPQENSSHWNCDYVAIGGEKLLAWGEKPISFNFSRYTQEELTAKAHSYELVPCESNVLCLDAAQSGIGSNSCGPDLLEQYQLREDQTFVLHLRFR